MRNIVLMSTSLILLSCTHSTSNDQASQETFGIYLLKDSTITAGGAFLQPIDSLTLTTSAFLSLNDLTSYVWSTHAFELTDESRTTYERFLISHRRTSGVPFVVTVGNDRIYVGTFWWAYSSSMPPACAVIEAVAPLPYRIRLADGAIDRRNDSRIYSSLKSSGVLVE